MQARSIILVVAIGLVLIGIALYGAYYLGARAERLRYERALADSDAIAANLNAELGKLRLALESASSRADSIGRGLGEAVDTASRITDRTKRIAVLVSAIGDALRLIRGEP